MRMFSVPVLAGCIVLAIASPSFAQGTYLGGQLGIGGGGGEFDNTGLDLELDVGLFMSGFVGKDYGRIRVEGELAYRQNDMNNLSGLPVIGEMTSLALMGNGYFDLLEGHVTPYLGVGAGLANVTFDSAAHDSDVTLAVQIMLGLAVTAFDNITMTIEYRGFAALPEFEDNFGVPFEQGYGIGSFSIGMRAQF